jgi:hypothetical protein
MHSQQLSNDEITISQKTKNRTGLRLVRFFIEFGASNEVRTRDLDLGKVALYQLSYTRIRQRCYVVMARILQNQSAYASTLLR